MSDLLTIAQRFARSAGLQDVLRFQWDNDFDNGDVTVKALVINENYYLYPDNIGKSDPEASHPRSGYSWMRAIHYPGSYSTPPETEWQELGSSINANTALEEIFLLALEGILNDALFELQSNGTI